MKVLVESNRALPLVQLVVCFGGGAAHDPPDRGGLANLACRMLRRGCQGMTAEQIEARVDSLGGELATHASLGSISVGCEMLSRSAESLTELLATLLAQPSFDAEELAKLQRQAEAELISSRDDDGLLASRALRRHLFEAHPHGRRLAGTVASLKAVSRDELQSFHQRTFCRNNALVAVCGDVDHDRARLLADKLMSGLAEGEAIAYPAAEPTSPEGRNLVIVDKADRSQSKLGIGSLGTHPRDVDHTALLVANTVFGGTFTSRLTREVRGERGWSYGASSHLTISHVREAFSMWTAPSAEDSAACLALELDLLQRWVEEGIEQDELDFSRAFLQRSYAFEIDTAKKRLGQKLERVLLRLPEDYHDGFIERVGDVSLQEANAAIRARIDPSRLWVAAVASEKLLGASLRQLSDWRQVLVEPFDLE